MTVKELKTQLDKCDDDKVVILVESDGQGWDNIGVVIETLSTVKLIMDGNHPFEK